MTCLMQSGRQEQRTPQDGLSRPSNSSWPHTIAAHSSGRQSSSAAWPTSATRSRAAQRNSSHEASEQEQEEQQHQFFQQLHGQRAPTPANYGPAEQAEAKRQANKEAALTWLDKAKAAAANKDWTAAVSDPCNLWSLACLESVLTWQASVQQRLASPDLLSFHNYHGPHAEVSACRFCCLMWDCDQVWQI